jgi:hypothetical protein
MYGNTPAASFTVYSDTLLIAATPPLVGTATYDVTVTTPTGTSLVNGSDHLTINGAARPTVMSVTPPPAARRAARW